MNYKHKKTCFIGCITLFTMLLGCQPKNNDITENATVYESIASSSKISLVPSETEVLGCSFAINESLGCNYTPDQNAPPFSDLFVNLRQNDFFSGIVKASGSSSSIKENGVEIILPAPTASVPYPNIAFQKWSPSWNWSNAGGLTFNITNPSAEEIKLFFKITDSTFSNAYLLYRTVPAGQTKNIAFRFNGVEKNIEGYSQNGTAPDLSNITQIEMFAAGDVGKQQFVVNDIAFLELDNSQKMAACNIESTLPLETLEHIVDFEKPSDVNVVTRINGSVIKVNNYKGDNALKLDIAANESGYPGLEFSLGEKGTGTPWDWSKKGNASLAIDIANPGKDSVQLYLRIDDDVNKDYGGKANGIQHSRNGAFVVEANSEFTTYYFPLSEFESSFDTGMRGQPISEYEGRLISYVWGVKTLDLSNIQSFLLYQLQPSKSSEVYLDNIRLVRDVSDDMTQYKGIIDQYGQFTKDNWKNKISSDSELVCLGEKDKQLVESVKPVLDRSKFGGYAANDAPRLAATGYFRVQKYQGRWMFVDPEGYLYWMTGLDNTRMDDTNTITGVAFTDQKQKKLDYIEPSEVLGNGYIKSTKPRAILSATRRDMFTWLPEYTDMPMAENYAYAPLTHKGALKHGEVFSFYQANLMRKYKTKNLAETLDIWADVTLARMIDWGFTSLGNWSDPSRLYRNGKIPYTAHGWIGATHKTIATNSDYWTPMHDPFDPAFRISVKTTVDDVAEKTKNDPFLIGTFIDNELSWGDMVQGDPSRRYTLAIATLTLNAKESPAKHYFVEQLKASYQFIEKLNTAWESDYASWDVFASSLDAEILPTPTSTIGTESKFAYERDLANFMVAISAQFHRVIKEELKAVMPNHLYLGSRFSDWGVTPEVQIGAAQHVDVMSYNLYAEKPLELVNFDTLEKLDMPAIVGEFHFGSMDSGLFSLGLIAANDQEDRGVKYNTYMSSILDHPNFVGAHWFQYLDSPTTGRSWDGENYNVGFVRMTDVPYLPLVNAAKAFNENMYSIRLKQK